MKKDFLESIEIQRLKKENTSLQNKLQILEEKAKSSSTNEKIHYKDIKLGSNIREEATNEIIRDLALSIIDKGQLQSILITSDNYLIAGYRRYNAIKLLNDPDEDLNNILQDTYFGKKTPQHLITYRLDIKYDQLSHEEIDELQFIENEERRSLDNFDISNLFCKYESLGYKQEDIAKRFKKTKGFVSSIISLKKIDPYIIKLLREFQVYGMSKEKYQETNILSLDTKEIEKINKSKGIIGWNTLYKIAVQKDLNKQKEFFLKSYENRLSDSEKYGDFFKDIKSKETSLNKKSILKAVKQTSGLKRTINELKKGYIGVNDKDLHLANDYILELESIFNKLESK